MENTLNKPSLAEINQILARYKYELTAIDFFSQVYVFAETWLYGAR